MKPLILHQILHDLTQFWLNGEDFSIRRILRLKRDFLKERILDLKITRLDVDLDGVKLLPLAYRRVINGLEKYSKKRIVINNSDLLNISLDQFKHKVKSLRPLFQLRDYIQRHFTKEDIFGFYVHGSLSSWDFVDGYSDCDTLVVVRKEVIEDSKWLINFRRRLVKSNALLYLLDPLQHHGHFVITEYDMEAYAEPFFPLELFKYATELSDFANSLTFHVRDADRELEYAFRFWMKYFQNPYEHGFIKNSNFSVKQFIQSLALMPTIYLQLKNKNYIHKKYSFDLAKVDFDAKTWNIVEKASMVRQGCSFKSYYPYWLRRIIGLYGHPKLLAYLHRKFDRNNATKMLNIMGPNMLKAGLDLVKEMQKRIDL